MKDKEDKKKEDMFLMDIERERERKDMKGKYMTERIVSTSLQSNFYSVSKRRSSGD